MSGVSGLGVVRTGWGRVVSRSWIAAFSNRTATLPGLWEMERQVARSSGLRKEWHNRGRDGNEGRDRGNWYIVGGDNELLCVTQSRKQLYSTY